MATEPPQHLHPWEKGPLERTDDEHVEAADYQFHGLGSVVQMTRRLRDAMVRQQKATNWLAIGIFVLTVALVLIALGVIGPIYTTSAWVLWGNRADLPKQPRSVLEWELHAAFEDRERCQRELTKRLDNVEKGAQKSGADNIVRSDEDGLLTWSKGTGKVPERMVVTRMLCLPGTLDPREKK